MKGVCCERTAGTNTNSTVGYVVFAGLRGALPAHMGDLMCDGWPAVWGGAMAQTAAAWTAEDISI